MRFFLLLFLVLFSSAAFSQRSHFGSWNVITTKITFNDHWGAYNEMQLRSQSFYHDNFYYEIKGGVSYAVNKNLVFLLGTGNTSLIQMVEIL